MNTEFENFVTWAGGTEKAARRLDCSQSLVRLILSGRRGISKSIAQRAHDVSEGQFDRTRLIFGDEHAA
jgi:hypothetical protein